MSERVSDAWVMLSNRLLLLQEIMVGLSQLPFGEVLSRAADGIGWVFDGGALHSVSPQALSPPPLIARGRIPLEGYGEVYLAYFTGPPEPLYLILAGIDLTDPQEFRLAALYFEHLLAALSAAGYREELEKQAQTDWLTGLGNRRPLAALLEAKPEADAAIGLLELPPLENRTQAVTDELLVGVAKTLQSSPGRALRVGSYRFAVFCAAPNVPAIEASLPALVRGWAQQQELKAKTQAALFEQAEVRLEGALAARWSAELAPRRPFAESAVRVSCGLPAVESAWQERVQSWPIRRSVELLLDLPHGFALEQLAALSAPVLLVTDSPSTPYLYDLLTLQPQGLLVGAPSDETIIAGLGRVLTGETFYSGPDLPNDGLYPREREVWHLIVRGLSNTQIARNLGISDKTVANYVTSLQDKLFLKNRVALVLHYLGKLESRRP